jgi:hypothetical protein
MNQLLQILSSIAGSVVGGVKDKAGELQATYNLGRMSELEPGIRAGIRAKAGGSRFPQSSDFINYFGNGEGEYGSGLKQYHMNDKYRKQKANKSRADILQGSW